jgi:hypothetical protein
MYKVTTWGQEMASVTLIDNVARMVQQGNSHDRHARTTSEISAVNR